MTAPDAAAVAYPPLNTLKPVADSVWIVDGGPLRVMGLPVPIRMTVIRLSSGVMWLHSPTPHDPELQRAIEAIAPIGHIVAPSVAHWTFVRDWQASCPRAATWAAPGLVRRLPVRRSGIEFDHELGRVAPEAFSADLDQVTLAGGMGVNEVAFLHRRTRTLVLTDLVQNFEPQKLGALARPLVRAAGAMAPDGKAPVHLRLVMRLNRRAAAAAAQRMVDWRPERVIFAHGRWFDRNGAARLRRSLRWLLR